MMRAARLRGLDTGRRLEAQFFDGLFAHEELLDFAGDGHGELVGELDVAGDLVVGDFAPAVVAD